MSRPTWLEIDTAALQHNLKRVRTYAPHSAVLAMIKANAYGHGLKETAEALNDAEALGVACLQEALQLRAAGIKQTIVLMEGFFTADELLAIGENDLDVVIHHPRQLEILANQPPTKPIAIWLKIDTGMHRLGFLPQEVDQVWQHLITLPWLKGKPKLLSHFSDPDRLEKSSTLAQFKCFNDCNKNFSDQRSLANSAAIIAWPETHFEWVRPGIMLYGVSPFADREGADFGLEPVMTLHSQLMAVKQLQKGETIGYGGTWACPENMPVGVVAIGYGDGYPRHAVNGTPVLVNDHKVPLVGRVSMDMLTVDLRTQPNAKIGDSVILWGKGLPVEKIARNADTIGYDLLCKITNRVTRKKR